jgi:hypothetical protein
MPGVSAVMMGLPAAMAWNTLFGTTRDALSLRPKMPSTIPHDATSSPRRS